MTAVAPHRATRYEVWDDYPAAGGARVDFLPRAEVVRCATPASTDTMARAALEVVPSARAIAALAPGRVLRLPAWAPDGTPAGVEYYRLLSDELTLAAGAQALRATAESPLLDWGAAGRMRTVAASGIASFVFTGTYTPAEALALGLGWLAARGRGYWVAGTIDRTDRKLVTIDGQTALELLRQIERLWDLEAAIAIAADESTIAVHLRDRVAAGGAVPTLRYGAGGALLSVTRLRDATEQATAVLPLGADGATIGLVPWRVTAAETVTNWVDLVDRNGRPGPIQIDGQLVGASLQRMDGTRVAIVDSQQGNGLTSRVRVTDATGFSATSNAGWGDDVEFRADAGGTRLVVLEDPTVAAADRVEVPLPRTDLDVARNYVPNARGQQYTTTSDPPNGWACVGDPTTGGRPADQPGITGGTLPGTPPVGDGTGWRVWIGYDLNGIDSPGTFAIDPVGGDAMVSVSVWVYVDQDLSYTDGNNHTPSLRIQLVDADTGVWVTGAQADFPSATSSYAGRSWAMLGFQGFTLGATRRLRVRVTHGAGASGGFPTNPSIWSDRLPVYLAAVQITRTATAQPFLDASRAELLWQAGNAHLVGHRAPVTTPAATVDDRATRDPGRYGDQPLTPGGDVRLVATALGLDVRARVVGWTRERTAPGPVPLTLVALPDAAAAQLLGAASPQRPRTLTELLAGR